MSINVAASAHEAPRFGDEPSDDEAPQVHILEVHDARGSFLCRLFLQPTEGGCHVQLDTEPPPEDAGPGASLRVAHAPNLVLIGVRGPERP